MTDEHPPERGELQTDFSPSQNGNKKSTEKDWWDKFSSISTLMSTVLIAAVGGWFTHRFSVQEADYQHHIQETQTVAQLMPYLTSENQTQKRTALIAIKVLQDATLMVELAASEPDAPGAREALREIAFHALSPKDRSVAIGVLQRFEFAPSCPLPFRDIAIRHEIDGSCGVFGSSPSDSSLGLQNSVKNNFCAGPNYRSLTLEDFARLQQEADARLKSGRSAELPSDRSRLQQEIDHGVGEGSAARFIGYVLGAHYADVQVGESVNCRQIGQEMNDIHVQLVAKPDQTDPCQSITAEISPHMRPKHWEVTDLAELAKARTLVRIGGQLMFDASHRPCGEGGGPAPKRLSSWEIHPVYAIDACQAEQQGACPEEKWAPLEKSSQ